jgi:hypothetical protein
MNVLRNNTLTGKFLLSLPWILFYVLGWAAGELSGYLFGKAQVKGEYFG